MWGTTHVGIIILWSHNTLNKPRYTCKRLYQGCSHCKDGHFGSFGSVIKTEMCLMGEDGLQQTNSPKCIENKYLTCLL